MNCAGQQHYIKAYTPLGQGIPIPTVVPITPSAPRNEMMQPEEAATLNKSGNSQLYPNLTAKLAALTSLRKPTSEIDQADNKKKSKPKCTDSHTTCSYVAGYGMVWEDLCSCSSEAATGTK